MFDAVVEILTGDPAETFFAGVLPALRKLHLLSSAEDDIRLSDAPLEGALARCAQSRCNKYVLNAVPLIARVFLDLESVVGGDWLPAALDADVHLAVRTVIEPPLPALVIMPSRIRFRSHTIVQTESELTEAALAVL